MTWSFLIKRFRYYLQYFPFTLNAVVTGVVIWLCFYLLKPAVNANSEHLSSFSPIILIIGKIAIWVIISLIGFSILTTILCWLLYLIQSSGINLEFLFKANESGKGLSMETFLRKARRPFLGFIKGRLLYDRMQMTDKFILASNKREPNRFWRTGVSGKNNFSLPDIKEYSIQGGFIYFEDMLQLFSIPVKQSVKGHFYQAPEQISLGDNQAVPKKTEQTDTRIEQLRRVDGEYLNYKDFEGGDDVRRIVWKVYAKNRELVVRVPEIFDPYASHIYYYASFNNTLIQGENDFTAEMLNYYKNRVWSIYEVLSKKEFEVRFVPDQQLQIPEQINKDLLVQRTISNSDWQTQQSLPDFFSTKFGAVLCISSLNSPEEIKSVLEQCSNDVIVYYVKLSRAFHSFAPWAWFIRIFLLPPNDRLKRIRSRWILTPMRWKLVKREKEIEKILASAETSATTL